MWRGRRVDARRDVLHFAEEDLLHSLKTLLTAVLQATDEGSGVTSRALSVILDSLVDGTLLIRLYFHCISYALTFII